MPRGGPGSAPKLRLPTNWPRTNSYLVWSHSGGRWWRVDGGESRDAMVASCLARITAAARGTPGDPRRGLKPRPPIPGARFVLTDRNGNPQFTEGTVPEEVDA